MRDDVGVAPGPLRHQRGDYPTISAEFERPLCSDFWCSDFWCSDFWCSGGCFSSGGGSRSATAAAAADVLALGLLGRLLSSSGGGLGGSSPPPAPPCRPRRPLHRHRRGAPPSPPAPPSGFGGSPVAPPSPTACAWSSVGKERRENESQSRTRRTARDRITGLLLSLSEELLAFVTRRARVDPGGGDLLCPSSCLLRIAMSIASMSAQGSPASSLAPPAPRWAS